MNRRSPLAFAYLVIASGAFSAFAWGQEEHNPFAAVQIRTTDLGSGLYMMEGAGGNLGLSIGDDGVFLIDDQYAPMGDKIKGAIAELTDQPISYLVNTHWHQDHTGGNEVFAKSGALIFAHNHVRHRMASVQTTIRGEEVGPSPAAALPVVTYSEEMHFHINGLDIHMIHAERAHTDGDTIIHFRDANILHMGDMFFNGMYPFIDLASGGTLDGLIAGCELAFALMDEDTKIMPGHGPLATRADFESYIDMLKGVRTTIGSRIEAGESKEDILAAEPLMPLDKQWGGGFIKTAGFTELVYEIIRLGKN